jgi:MFS family permease
VIHLAPESRRGIYLSLNSLCWAAGYFIGPTLGGWAMGETRRVADGFWIGAVLSVGLVLLILQVLHQELRRLGKLA